MSENIRIWVLIIEMLVLSIQDMKQKKISLVLLCSMGVIAVAVQSCEVFFGGEKIDEIDLVIGFVFGMALMGVGYLTGALGIGDGLVILLISAMNGGVFAVVVFVLAMTIAGFTGLILLFLKKVKKKDNMPFVPYLFLSLLGVVICM